jgi:hypothetical protein
MSLLSLEGRSFIRFEKTCFQKVGNRLPDYTVLHPRNSMTKLQIYIAGPQKRIHYTFVYTATSLVHTRQ